MGRLPDFEGLALFVRISDEGSISEVSRSLGLPKSTVSKRLRALEARLGVQLINRTTRRMSLTDAGRSLLSRAAPAVHEIAAIENDVVSRTGAPEGLVRIASPVGLGQSVLMPLVGTFLKLYPAVSLEMAFVDRHVDMVAEGFDLLVQHGALADTSLVARHLTDYRRLLVASPAYLAAASPITRIEDVCRHEAIQLYASTTHWTFLSQGDETEVRPRSRLAVQNLLGIHRAAIDGLGLALIPDYVIGDDLRTGRLVHVLPEVSTPLVRASLLYPASRVQPMAVRKLIEFLLGEFRGKKTRSSPVVAFGDEG